MDSYSKLHTFLRSPNLTTPQLNALLALRGSEGEDAAIEKIIASYQKVVYRISHRLFAKVQHTIIGASLLDFVQQGNIGLWTAIKKYDGSKGSFTAYAQRGISRSIIRLIENTSGIVRKPAKFHERWRRLLKQKDNSTKEELESMNLIIDSSVSEITDNAVESDDNISYLEIEEFLTLVEEGLSQHHADALKGRLEGYSNTELARKMHLSRKTVIALFNDLKNVGASLDEMREKLVRIRNWRRNHE